MPTFEVGCSLCILGINPLSDMLFVDISPHSMGYCFSSMWIMSFDGQGLKTSKKFSLSVFSSVACAFGVVSKKSLPNPMNAVKL